METDILKQGALIMGRKLKLLDKIAMITRYHPCVKPLKYYYEVNIV